MTSKTHAKGFDPTKGLTWTAETNVESMKNLVKDKETVFARHRKFDNGESCVQCIAPSVTVYSLTIHRDLASLQASSKREVEESYSEDGILRAVYDRYSEFCQAVNIPVAPISMSTIALFLFTKCSHKNGNYQTCLHSLKRLRLSSLDLWEEVEGMDILEDSVAVAVGLSYFMHERKGVRIKAPRGSSLSSYLYLNEPSTNDDPYEQVNRSRQLVLLKTLLPPLQFSPMLQTIMTIIRKINVAVKLYINW